MRILYLGSHDPSGTGFHRAAALRRIGCEVEIVDPGEAYRGLRLHPKLNYLTGYRLVNGIVNKFLDQRTRGREFDLAWVDLTYQVPRESVELLKERCKTTVGYFTDDPTGVRDHRLWATCRRALCAYDLCAVLRPENEKEFPAAGAKRTVRIWFSYDELAHEPFPSLDRIPQAFRSEVVFIGTWMKERNGLGRDQFMLKLIDAGIPLSIWGNRWQKAPQWNRIKPHWRGPALGGRDLVAAMQGAKIALGLLSHGNRDLHTQRSVELPFAGGLLCAERTSEHLQMYCEGEEAVFWSSPGECIDVCRQLLADDARRVNIAAAGMRRIRQLGFSNESVCRKLLVELGHPIPGSAPQPLYRLKGSCV